MSEKVLPIKISFSVTEQVHRFVYLYALLGEKVYLIDAGVAGALPQIEDALQRVGRTVEEIAGILLTHTHPDHIGCIAAIKEVAPLCKVYVSAGEKAWLEDIDVQYQQRPIPNFYRLAGASAIPDETIRPGDKIALEKDITLSVKDCSGHSHGSVGYLWEEEQALFSGDAIPQVGDAPIFESLQQSLATIRRLQALRAAKHIYSAWAEPKSGAEIVDNLAQAKDCLTNIRTAVAQVCTAESISGDERIHAISESAGLSGFSGHPLFQRSLFMAVAEYYETAIESTAKNLARRGLTVVTCTNAGSTRDAVANMLRELEPASIGFGNSQTVRLCGIVELAKENAQTVLQHDPRCFSAEDDRQALLSDVYFTSANALSQEGHIVNIDGTGNRVGATCFGPREVVYIIGRNKIVQDLPAAMQRATWAAIQLASFYGRKTPCAKTGKCHDCLADECVCGVTAIHRKALIGNHITVVLVNEDMGI